MKVIVIILSVLLPIFGKSQTQDVYKFRAFQAAAYKSTADENEEKDWKRVDILVTINLKKKKVSIYSKTPQHIDLISVRDQKTEKYHAFIFEGIDNDGEEVLVTYIYHLNNDNHHIASLFIDIDSLIIAYKMKKV